MILNIEKEANENGDDEKGILASLIFLKGESKKGALLETEQALDVAIKAFFEDFKTLGKFDEHLENVRNFLEKISSMDKAELSNLLQLIQFFDEAGQGDFFN